jgi:flagellar protein FlaG
MVANINTSVGNGAVSKQQTPTEQRKADDLPLAKAPVDVGDGPEKIREQDRVSKGERVAKPDEVENAAATQAREAQASKEARRELKEREIKESLREKVETSVESIRGFIKENQRDLDFEVSERENRVIISVIDTQTQKVIRKIPPEEAISLAERINQGEDVSSAGVLLESKA